MPKSPGRGHSLSRRLCAIGHTHEAQNESQARPHLHYASREVHRAYQERSGTPDLDAIIPALLGPCDGHHAFPLNWGCSPARQTAGFSVGSSASGRHNT